MDVINPFAGAIAQTPALQKQQSAEKAAQVRHLQELKKNVASRRDEYEHVVESAEELFQSGAKPSSVEHEALQAQLYEQIGRLKTELDWLKKKAARFG